MIVSGLVSERSADGAGLHEWRFQKNDMQIWSNHSSLTGSCRGGVEIYNHIGKNPIEPFGC